MDGEQRREKIIDILNNSKEAISGTSLAKKFHVSRQVIVQDIALIRASNKDVISTTKGYLLYEEENNVYRRVLAVQHTNEQIEDELNTIVDHGAKVLNVIVEHAIYGDITVDLIINNRMEAKEFVEKVKAKETVPLMGLTGGVHYHTIEADSEETLDLIANEFKEKGYLIS